MHTSHMLPLLLAIAGSLAAADPSLLSNGGFETDADGDARPDGWNLATGATWVADRGNHFVRMTGAGTSTQVSVYRECDVAGAKAVTISYRVRYADVKRGSQPWHDARIIMEVKDAAKQVIKGAMPHPFFVGTSDWVEKSVSRVLPAGATTLSIMPALFMVEHGTFDVDDITVVAVDPANLPTDK